MHVSFLTPVDLQRSKFETFLWTEIISPNPKLRWYFTVWSKSSLLYKGVTQMYICVMWPVSQCHILWLFRPKKIRNSKAATKYASGYHIRCQSLFSWSQIASIFTVIGHFWPRLVQKLFLTTVTKTGSKFLIWPRAESVFESSTLPK